MAQSTTKRVRSGAATKQARAPRRSTGKKPAAPPVKFSVPLPPEVHRALGIASLDRSQSNSTLIREIVEERFATAAASPLRLLRPATRENDWKRVSVFLPPTLKAKAELEVERQYGASKERFAVSLSAAIAGLVAARFVPKFKF